MHRFGLKEVAAPAAGPSAIGAFHPSFSFPPQLVITVYHPHFSLTLRMANGAPIGSAHPLLTALSHFAGYLVAVPLVVGFLVSRAVAAPLWDFAETVNPAVFDLSEEQKIEGAQEVKMEEVRKRMVS